MKTLAALSRNNLIWIDLEMTGLLPDRDRIIEIATIVTDTDLNVLAEGPVLAITQSAEQLALMDDWNRTTHGETGLIGRVELSTLSEQEAEQKTLQFLMQWVPKNCSPLCGNSIGHDRQFLLRYMPTLAAYFHYRVIDVSTLKELAKRWRPDILSGFKKQATHKALDDIKESIAELAYYRQHFIQTE